MTSSSTINISSALERFSMDAQDLFVPRTIAELHEIPTPIEFLRQYVMTNTPVVIRGGAKHWPAIKKWSDEYLCDALAGKLVTVSMTPNGYADAPMNDRFVQPEERRMCFKEFLDTLYAQKENIEGGGDKDIPYIQKQNSSLTDEFSGLLKDTGDDIEWATEAFGCKPDAINFWMGGEHSVTSMHKDPYENLYGVVRGSKTFLLYPPTDLHCIPYELYTPARYKKVEKSYQIIDDRPTQCSACEANSKLHAICYSGDNNNLQQKTRDASLYGKNDNENKVNLNCDCNCQIPPKVPWVAIDPLKPNLKKYPQYAKSSPRQVEVYTGDLLYLPSLWFHHVQQQNGTIAVNYWYDMHYDLKYIYYKLLERLTQPNLIDISLA